MTIICFGDSITYGNWDHKGGWVGRLRDYLDSKSIAAYSGEDLYSKYYTVTYNLGIPGDTSAGLFARFEGELIPRFNPKEETIILFDIGNYMNIPYMYNTVYCISIRYFNIPNIISKRTLFRN